MKIILNKPDTLGAFASTLCVVHCLVTPLIFMTHSCSKGSCTTKPYWWQNLDFILLIISFIAIRHSVKNTSKSFMKPALWFCWGTLILLIINEKMQFVILSESLMHIAALSLTALHIYNLKYCQCKNNKCCTLNG